MVLVVLLQIGVKDLTVASVEGFTAWDGFVFDMNSVSGGEPLASEK